MHSKQAKTITAVGVLLLAVAGCGQTVELDQPGKVIPSHDPNVLGTVREHIVQLGVDDERVYWLTAAGALRGCDKQRCAGTVATYSEQASSFGGFAVRGGELFYASTARPPGVVAVATTDTTLSRVVLPDIEPTALMIDDDHLYLSDGMQVQVIALGTEGAVPISVPLPSDSVTSLVWAIAANGAYVYWLETRDLSTDLKRARNDGTSEPETLVANVRVDPYYGHGQPGDGSTVSGLAVDSSYVYWSENLLSGAIKRLSLSGASAEPETVVAPIRFPMGLQLDASVLYVEHETDAYEYAVSACRLDECEPQKLASNLATTNAFALDSGYLYTATTSQSRDPDVPTDHPTTVLRRSSRETGGHER